MHGLLTIFAVFLFLALPAFVTDSTVTRIPAWKPPGAQIADLYCDHSGINTPSTVTMEFSGDSGTIFATPAHSLCDHLSSGVTASVASSAPEGFVLVPAGSFLMGDSFSEGSSNELPTHTITLSAFYLAKMECTKGQWDGVRTWSLANGYTDLFAGAGEAANHPVHTISWLDIVKWCNAASEKAGFTPCYTVSGVVMRTGASTPRINYAANGYRLPTEAEWEYAARGGLKGKRFPWGDTIAHSQANYFSCATQAYDVSTTRGFHPIYKDGTTTIQVGSFAPNDYGLFDMAGNVYEFCADWYSDRYYLNSPARNPTGPAPDSYRIVRGGSFGGNIKNCRVSHRSGNEPTTRDNFVGFRIARSLLP